MGVLIPDRDDKGRVLQWNAPFASNFGFRFRGTGAKGIIPKGTESFIQYKFLEKREINGVELILKNQEWDDTVKFQVVDVDNILGFGENLLLDQFGMGWNVATDKESQGAIILNYSSEIIAGLYIRLLYNSTGTVNDVKAKMNMFLHKSPV